MESVIYKHKPPVAQLIDPSADGLLNSGKKWFRMKWNYYPLIAQLVELLPLKEKVSGSSPDGGTKMYTVYVIQNNKNKRIYIGYTSNLKKD